MPSPSNEFENLQTVYMRTYNRLVQQSFRENIPDDDFSTPESQMKNACLVKDNDSASIMQLRVDLFFMVREEGKRLHPIHYEMPLPEWESTFYRPQVILRFEEVRPPGGRVVNPKTVRVSFRLTNETAETITQTEVDGLSRRIEQQFPRSYVFKTGRYKMSYRDKSHGYELILSPYSRAIGERMIGKVLAVGGHEPDWERMTVSEAPQRNYLRDEYIRVLGNRQMMPKRRRVAEVILKKAVLKVHGQLADIPLYAIP